ncbi:AAA family ATPase [bacterium]|nr:AAA family ATPase [bacterium]
MKLKRVKIKDFRSIVKMDLVIEDNITTLVGANEHGKSNILAAISLLNTGTPFDIKKDKRIDGKAKKYCPSVRFFLELNQEDKKVVQETMQSKYLPTTIQNEDGTTSEGKPEKIIKLKDVPENIEYERFIKEEDDKSYYRINCPDEDTNEAIYNFISNDFSSKIIYFDEFNDRLESVIPKGEILKSEDNLIIQGLLKVCELQEKKERIFTDDIEIRQLLDRAPEKITKAVKKAWYQGLKDDISIKIIRDSKGENLLIDIEDKNTYVDFKARSRGFKWFFSFFLKYRAYHDSDLKNSLFLIDEPGLFLHPKGQKDLLQYLERLGKANQIIYSTHSPFMINRLKEKRVRVVEKKQKDGTTINTKGFTANWRHMRTSLGMVLSDSFYFADKTLIVEGPEDVIYILCLLQFFIKKDNLDIDVNLLSIMDSGGVANLPAMAKIVKDEERPLVVLIDSDSQKILNKLKKYVDKKECEEIKTFNSNAITIQDLLPRKLYEQAVNKYIKRLVEDKLITLVNGGEKEYQSKNDFKIDKKVEGFVKENYNEESVSKVGIAREFEDLLNGKIVYKEDDFKNARKLIDWLVKTLDLKV